MKLLVAFFKDKTREISLYAGTVGIFIVVAFLYNIRMDALKYALLLVILWLLLYVITEYHRFRKKHLLLERFKKSTQECTKELPECRNLLELDYQELLGIFDEKIVELKSEARIKGQDLSDYYGMWVHQIKTPIAAMHILLQSVEDETPALPELKEMKMELFLADEPSGALDSKAADSLMNLFTTINQDGQTIVMVTHSVKAASSAKRVLFIKDGKVFHQLYRGNLTNEEMYERISDTLKILTTGGEEDE